jgi:3-oxoacyl-[acyl-carrier-protein] synthase III
MNPRSLVASVAGYLPERVMTNDELAKLVDTSDAWIVGRTGIRQRHIARPDEATSDVALPACERALAKAGLDAGEIDLLVVATSTPDLTFPSTASILQAKLGMRGGAAFDVQAVCSGFIYALATADNFIRAGQARNALVVGAETFSRLIDWTDRSTCVLFGDGAGAMVLRAVKSNGAGTGRGVLSTHLHSDGRYCNLLYADGGPGTSGEAGHVRMQGREIFRHAVDLLSAVVDEALAQNKLSPDAIDWFVPHQANRRIIDAMAKKLGLGPERVVVTVDRHANTSAASIPLALAEAAEDGRIKEGHLVLLEAIGGGLTWASAIVRW